jgi:hypothetical protein
MKISTFEKLNNIVEEKCCTILNSVFESNMFRVIISIEEDNQDKLISIAVVTGRGINKISFFRPDMEKKVNAAKGSLKLALLSDAFKRQIIFEWELAKCIDETTTMDGDVIIVNNAIKPCCRLSIFEDVDSIHTYMHVDCAELTFQEYFV